MYNDLTEVSVPGLRYVRGIMLFLSPDKTKKISFEDIAQNDFEVFLFSKIHPNRFTQAASLRPRKKHIL